jgi:hypothetical protein
MSTPYERFLLLMKKPLPPKETVSAPTTEAKAPKETKEGGSKRQPKDLFKTRLSVDKAIESTFKPQ